MSTPINLEAYQVERIQDAFDLITEAEVMLTEAFCDSLSNRAGLDASTTISNAQLKLAKARGIISGHLGFPLHGKAVALDGGRLARLEKNFGEGL